MVESQGGARHSARAPMNCRIPNRSGSWKPRSARVTDHAEYSSSARSASNSASIAALRSSAADRRSATRASMRAALATPPGRLMRYSPTRHSVPGAGAAVTPAPASARPRDGHLGDPPGRMTAHRCLEARDVPAASPRPAGLRRRDQQVHDDVGGADFDLCVIAPVAVGIEEHLHHFFLPQPVVARARAAPRAPDRCRRTRRRGTSHPTSPRLRWGTRGDGPARG